MGKGRKQVLLSKGQLKISNFFKHTENEELQCDRSNKLLSPNIKASSSFPLVEGSTQEGELSGPLNNVICLDENSVTPERTSSVKRKSCSEESPDIIPSTPVSRKRIKSKSKKLCFEKGIVKLEKEASHVENKWDSLFSSHCSGSGRGLVILTDRVLECNLDRVPNERQQRGEGAIHRVSDAENYHQLSSRVHLPDRGVEEKKNGVSVDPSDKAAHSAEAVLEASSEASECYNKEGAAEELFESSLSKVNACKTEIFEDSKTVTESDIVLCADDCDESRVTQFADSAGKSESCSINSSDANSNHVSWDTWDMAALENEEMRCDWNKEELNLDTFQRCQVLELRSGDKPWEKVVNIQSTLTGATTSCVLRDFWADSSLAVGDIISIKAYHSETSWVIDNSRGLLVHHPDNLISSTAVVGSLFCQRRGVLSEWFRGIDGDSRIMVIGSVVHKLLQEVLERKLYAESAIRSLVQDLVCKPDCVRMLYSASMSKEEMVKELEGFVPHIIGFVNAYVKDSNPHVNKNVGWKGTISAIRDIEENLWVPQLGIKGKVDVTAEVYINAHKKSTGMRKVMPLELKTGRASFSAEHKGQVTLYTMMMSQLGSEVDSGLLLYLRDAVMEEVKAGCNERRDLILLRNQLAHFISRLPLVMDDGSEFKPPELPEPINHPSACAKCPYLTICTSFLGSDGVSRLPSSNPLKALAPSATCHLSALHVQYLIHWTGLVLLEEQEAANPHQQKDMWCLGPEQREKRGKSLCSMVVSGPVLERDNSYMHTLQKSSSHFTDLRKSDLTVGEYIAVSTNVRLAVATGTVSDITQTSLTLLLSRDLTKHCPGSLFHVDVYALQSGKVFNLTNLGSLMDNTDIAARLRKFIIDKEQPTYMERLQSNVMRPGHSILEPLNMSQRRAVVKALTANDYFLIKGMPGTGKTATIVSLVELLVKLRQSVLVTSHTHSAVDNVLVKLAVRGVSILRLGSASRIHPHLQAMSEAHLTAACTTPDQLEAVYHSKPVVGTTCLGANHPLLTRRTFDVCIVDESTQALQVSVLRPLFSARKFVLIGDPEQLPPVVRSKTARELGMSESLFARLDSPDVSVSLDLQYRMNRAITHVANSLTYNGHLKCGNEGVACATVQLSALQKVQHVLDAEAWLCPVLSTAMEHSVLVLDVGPVWKKLKATGAQETARNEDRAYTNVYEAAIILYVTTLFLKSGVAGNRIGVIAPYRAQVALLRKVVNTAAHVEVNTVDQYQGRDKDVVIFSCTKTQNVDSGLTQSRNKECEILGDKRRLTVAVTRAKHKLVIVGDVATLQKYQPFKQLFECLTSNQIFLLSDGKDNFDWNKLLMNMNATLEPSV